MEHWIICRQLCCAAENLREIYILEKEFYQSSCDRDIFFPFPFHSFSIKTLNRSLHKTVCTGMGSRKRWWKELYPTSARFWWFHYSSINTLLRGVHELRHVKKHLCRNISVYKSYEMESKRMENNSWFCNLYTLFSAKSWDIVSQL